MNQEIAASENQRADHQDGCRPNDIRQNVQSSLSHNTHSDDERDNATELAQEASRLLDNLSAHDVLFYPLADVDLETLHRASSLADVFVFADWRWPSPSEGHDAIISEMVNGYSTLDGVRPFSRDAEQGSFEVPAEQVQAVSGVSTHFGLFSEPKWLAGYEPWARVTRIKRRSGDVEHPVWVVHIVGNCIEVYQKLFLERAAAPKALWLDCPLGANLDGWAKFISPGGEFGRVFSTAARQPQYVVAQRYKPGWRQTVPCNRLSAWHPAFNLILFAQPDAAMDADEGGQESR